MAFEVQRDASQLAMFVFLVLFSVLGVMLVVGRFMATRRKKPCRGVEDWFVVVGAICAVLNNVAGLVAIRVLNGREITPEVTGDPDNFSHLHKAHMASLFCYIIHSCAIKLSMLAFYYRLFGVCPAFRIAIYVLGAVQTALGIVLLVLFSLQCQPFQLTLEVQLTPPGVCELDGLGGKAGLGILVGEVPLSVIDFLMVALAMYMIRTLKMSSVNKWRLRFLFGLGIFIGIIGLIKVGVLYWDDWITAFLLASMISGTQMLLSILCCCLPVFNQSLPSNMACQRLYQFLTRCMRRRRHPHHHHHHDPSRRGTAAIELHSNPSDETAFRSSRNSTTNYHHQSPLSPPPSYTHFSMTTPRPCPFVLSSSSASGGGFDRDALPQIHTGDLAWGYHTRPEEVVFRK